MNQIRQRLEELRDEAHALAGAQPIDVDAFTDWHRRTRDAIQEIYGAASKPFRDFSSIRFDDTEVIDAVDRVMRKTAKEKGVDMSGLKIRLPDAETARRRGLYEAAELLSSLML